jgi:glycosyltransferase involved in cell wall biosynthesis
MATYSRISASLERTLESVARLEASEKRVQLRIRKLDETLQAIRQSLTTGRGAKIRGQISKAVLTATAVIESIELLEVRKERIKFKWRNLQLDITHGLSGSDASRRPQLIEQSKVIARRLEKRTTDYQSWRRNVSDMRSELKKHSIRAEWHHKVDICIDLFRAGFDELGLTRLLNLCYGPDTPGDHRRRAMNELLSWGHTVQDQQIIDLASKHLSSYVATPERSSASERELVVRLEGLRLSRPFSDPENFLLIIDAAKRASEDALLATANLLAGFHLDRLPSIGSELQLLWINKTLAVQKLEPIRFEVREGVSLFDTVDCDVDPSTCVESGALVSVIIPAWNSEAWLETAVRGLVKQSWRNLEIIIVDDCSDDSTLAVARKLAKRDKRIRVLANKANRGAYGSRNWALEVSTGEYITVHDADDWSHPRKIERQVSHLQKNEQIVANLSRSVRIDQDSLLFFAQYGREFLRQNSSSLMFKRDTVFAELGYWDEVKFGADTEYHHRIRSKFGPDSAPIANLGMLSLTRYHSASLTGGGNHSTQRGIVGARRDYLGKFDAWHKQIKEDENFSLYMPRAVKERPFPIPISSAVDENNRAHFDLLVVANLSLDTAWLLSMYELARDLTLEGKSVAFMHLPGLLRPTQAISDQFEKLVADGGAVRIYAENDCETDRAILQASALKALNVLMPELSAARLEVVYDDESISVDPASLAEVAKTYFGSEPVFFGVNRETKTLLNASKSKVTVSSKVWKFD